MRKIEQKIHNSKKLQHIRKRMHENEELVKTRMWKRVKKKMKSEENQGRIRQRKEYAKN